MSIFERLKNNKGTVSSALGKTLANQVLNGNFEILKEAIELCSYKVNDKKEKNIRSGAAKIVECVSMEQPTLVAPYLSTLLTALSVEEPQTRWMIIRVFGLCASLQPEIAKQALPYARKFIHEKKEGELCLVSSADLYLGDYGCLSKEKTIEVYPILMESTDNIILNEHDWLIEAFIKIGNNLDLEQKKMIMSFANEYQNHPRKTTQERVKKLGSLCKLE